jgi:hypothetical protein
MLLLRLVATLSALVYLPAHTKTKDQASVELVGRHVVVQPADGGSLFVGDIDLMAVIAVCTF